MPDPTQPPANTPVELCVDCDPPVPSQFTVQPKSAEWPHPLSAQIQAMDLDLPGPSNARMTTSQFIPPSLDSLTPSITIEFCDRCRWAPRATWIQTELFVTFPTPIIKSMTLQPLTHPDTGGRFRVWIYTKGSTYLAWDRKTEGGFPELKVLKQRVRNILQPDLNLGHSDVKPKDRMDGTLTGKDKTTADEEQSKASS